MNWDGFRVFLALARGGRALRAAKELGVEHTTVARRLEAFEAELGVRLFYRTVAGYRLTPHGEAALGQAQAMEQAAQATRARVEASSSQLAGRVRLALLEEFASHWLIPKLPAFYARYPGIELELKVGIPPLDLSRGDADLALRTPRPRQVGLSAVRLGSVRVALFAARSLVGDRRLTIDGVESAKGLPLLLYPREYHFLQSAAWLQPVLAATEPALVTNSTLTLLAAARAGLGVAVLPRFMARPYDDLVAVSADTSVGDHWLVAHPEVRREPRVRAVAEFLKKAATGPSGIR